MKKFALASGLVLVVGFGVFAAKDGADYTKFNQALTQDQQVLHALDRLTFGPQPGDVEAVNKVGLKKWIDLQLHPDRIAENPELAPLLEPLDSLRMSRSEMVQHYPPQQVVQAMATGRMALPKDPVTRAAVQTQIQRRQAKQDQDGKAKQTTTVTMQDGTTMQDGKANPDASTTPTAAPDAAPQAATLEKLRELLTPAQIRTLRNGTPEEKQQLLKSIPADKVDAIVIAMPQGMRQQLMASVDPALRRRLLMANAPQQVVPSDLSEGKLYRAIYSNRQLEEQMVDFWYNHFNVYLDKGADRALTTSYEREAIRPHVFGKFRDLLEATATSPAMLFYLDNWESVAANQQPGPVARRQQAKAKQKGKQQ